MPVQTPASVLPFSATPEQKQALIAQKRRHPLFSSCALMIITEIINSRLFTTVSKCVCMCVCVCADEAVAVSKSVCLCVCVLLCADEAVAVSKSVCVFLCADEAVVGKSVCLCVCLCALMSLLLASLSVYVCAFVR